MQSVHSAYRVPALARGLVKAVSKDGDDEIADEVDDAAAGKSYRILCFAIYFQLALTCTAGTTNLLSMQHRHACFLR